MKREAAISRVRRSLACDCRTFPGPLTARARRGPGLGLADGDAGAAPSTPRVWQHASPALRHTFEGVNRAECHDACGALPPRCWTGVLRVGAVEAAIELFGQHGLSAACRWHNETNETRRFPTTAWSPGGQSMTTSASLAGSN